MKTKYNVLDKGFVRVVDTMGDDSAIVQAARVSYGEGTKTPSDDRSLIRYLMRHWHSTPFEMCEIKLHVKLPVFVARQWIRHRTANVNEMSGRYSVLPNEFYIPRIDEVGLQSTTNKQGSDGVVDEDAAVDFVHSLQDLCEGAYTEYEGFLEDGVTREQARMALPPNIYTEWYWKIDLHNLLHFLRLRGDGHAQSEIRQYAYVMRRIVHEWVPVAYEAWCDYRVNAVHLSAQQVELLTRLLSVPMPKAQHMVGSKGEVAETQKLLLEKFNLDLNLSTPPF